MYSDLYIKNFNKIQSVIKIINKHLNNDIQNFLDYSKFYYFDKVCMYDRINEKDNTVMKIKIEGYINNYPHYEFDVDDHNEDFWYVPYKDIKKAQFKDEFEFLDMLKLIVNFLMNQTKEVYENQTTYK